MKIVELTRQIIFKPKIIDLKGKNPFFSHFLNFSANAINQRLTIDSRPLLYR